MNITDLFSNLLDKSKDYFEIKAELVKLKTIERSADVLSSVITILSIISGVILFLVFSGIALAIYVGRMLGDPIYGFLVLGGFYGLILFIIYILRKKWIKTPVASHLIKVMLN